MGAVAQVLKQCGGELTRVDVKQVQMGRFDGTKWELFGGCSPAR